MYRLILVSLLFSTLVLSSSAQWIKQYSGSVHRCIDFVDSANGWALGEAGMQIITTNGGKTWTDKSSGIYGFITQTRFLSATLGYCTAQDKVYITRDGGTTWLKSFEDVLSPAGDGFFSVVDTSHIWKANWTKGMFKSTNGGANWIRLDSTWTAKLMAVSFANRQVGVAAGWNGNVVYTTDGGSSWSNASSGTSKYINSIAMASPSRGLFVGEAGTIGLTTDGGRTWSNRSWNTKSPFNRVYFADSLNAWVVGDAGLILRTTDGGTTFRRLNFPRPNASLADVTTIGTNLVWVVDVFSGVYHSTTGGEVSRVELTANNAPTAVCDSVPVTLSFQITNGVPPYVYAWSTTDGDPIDYQDILRGGGSSDTLLVVKPTKDLHIRVIATDQLNEHDTLYFDVEVNKAPVLSLFEPDRYCDSNEYELRCNVSQNQRVTWTCQPSGYMVGPAKDTVFRVRPTEPGLITLTLTIVDTITGCISDTIVQRVVGGSPTVYIREQPKGVLDALFDFPISRASFRWFKVEGGNAMFLPFENKAQFYPSEPGIYGVEVIDDSSGCSRRNTYNYQTVSIDETQQNQAELVLEINVRSNCEMIEWSRATNGVAIEIYDVASRLVIRRESLQESGAIACTDINLRRGVYVVVAFDSLKRTSALMIVD